jgi:hypothetical protein
LDLDPDAFKAVLAYARTRKLTAKILDEHRETFAYLGFQLEKLESEVPPDPDDIFTLRRFHIILRRFPPNCAAITNELVNCESDANWEEFRSSTFDVQELRARGYSLIRRMARAAQLTLERYDPQSKQPKAPFWYYGM